MKKEMRESTQTLEDLLPLLDNLKPWEDGVGVMGRWHVSQSTGGSKAASDSLSDESTADGGGGESSKVLGTNTQRFKPKASFAFLHLLPIFFFPQQNELKLKPLSVQKLNTNSPEPEIKNPSKKWSKMFDFAAGLAPKIWFLLCFWLGFSRWTLGIRER